MAKPEMRIKKTKSRIKLAISCVIALVCVFGLISTGNHLIAWFKDSNEIEEQSEEIVKVAPVDEVEDNENTKVAEEPKKTSQYWKYLNTKLIDVKFDELLAQNSDTAGWIRVGGTNINYPFVQTTNNDYYLKHAFNHSYNDAGWVFADFRNHLDGTDKNLIIYAHGRYDGTMFGSLKNVLSSGWLKNPDNFIIRTSTPETNGLWQVFSVYHIPTTSDYLQVNFQSDEEYQNFLNMLQGRSAYDFEVSLSPQDKIITLSTCLNKEERVVMHAKLIKWEDK